MPHLYLPSEHTDADLILAADVAAAVSSADLYVTWTHDAGPGTPEVEAVVREESASTAAGNAARRSAASSPCQPVYTARGGAARRNARIRPPQTTPGRMLVFREVLKLSG